MAGYDIGRYGEQAWQETEGASTKSPAPESQISAAFMRATKAREACFAAFQELARRVEPVLSFSTPETAGGVLDKAAKDGGCPLEQMLHEHAIGLERLGLEISSVLRRVRL